ncbi:MAG TPA: nitrilase-related carbon-nitrogen hydrolase [Gaiellales bacterium]|jgi:predicted amidohydrolase
MHALLAQLASVKGDTAANSARAVAAIEAHPGVEIAVFPELYLGGYDLPGLSDAARTVDCPELAAIGRAAADSSTAVVVGFAEAIGDGRVANSLACFDRDGLLAGVYRKLQLFDNEARVFERGDCLRMLRLAGIDVGLLVCFDVEFPELARALATAGAGLLVTASANMQPYTQDHELASRARALENHLPHLYANAVGTPNGLQLVGHSRSIDASGTVLAEAPGDDELLLVAPLGLAGVDDERIDYLRHLPRALHVVSD